MTTLKIYNINLNRSLDAFISFCDQIKLSTDQPVCLMLLEPPLNPDGKINIPFIQGYKVYFVDSLSEPLYAAIFTNIERVFIDARLSNPWFVVAQIGLNDFKWVV